MKKAQRIILGLTMLIVLSSCTEGNYPVIVNYEMNETEILWHGNYWELGSLGWVRTRIPWESFDPANRVDLQVENSLQAEVSLELIEYLPNERGGHTEDVELYLHERGLRPATLRELLTFGATYPERQRDFTIVALGSSWLEHGSRYVMLLWNDCRYAGYSKEPFVHDGCIRAVDAKLASRGDGNLPWSYWWEKGAKTRFLVAPIIAH